MKKNYPRSRHNIFWVVILYYFIPIIALIVYSVYIPPAEKNWNFLSLGLFFSAFGALFLFLLMSNWEASWKKEWASQSLLGSVAQASPIPLDSGVMAASGIDEIKITDLEEALTELRKMNARLVSEVDKLSQESLRSEKERLLIEQQLQKVSHDFDSYKQLVQQQHEQQKNYINELEYTLAEQQNLIEKKQQQVGYLDTKVSDLTYEIKTLLQIAEKESIISSPYTECESNLRKTIPLQSVSEEENFNDIQPDKQVHSREEASQQLKRCLDIAQKITGSNRFSMSNASYLDPQGGGFSLDLRRLCDSLRSENSSAILLYSPKENEPLFVNNQIKLLTGWSPEKFVQSFNEIFEEGLVGWRQAIANLSAKNETQLNMSLKTKSGQEVILQAHLGLIPTGIFRHHVIAVIY